MNALKARTARLTAVFADHAAVPRELPGALDVRVEGRILVVVSSEADGAEAAIRGLVPERLDGFRLNPFARHPAVNLIAERP